LWKQTSKQRERERKRKKAEREKEREYSHTAKRWKKETDPGKKNNIQLCTHSLPHTRHKTTTSKIMNVGRERGCAVPKKKREE
jgi:hypothetical protein